MAFTLPEELRHTVRSHQGPCWRSCSGRSLVRCLRIGTRSVRLRRTRGGGIGPPGALDSETAVRHARVPPCLRLDLRPAITRPNNISAANRGGSEVDDDPAV